MTYERMLRSVMTQGFAALDVPRDTVLRLLEFAIARYMQDARNYFTLVTPTPLGIDISDGNEVIVKANKDEYPGITESFYIVFDDLAEEGLVLTFLLPSEY